MEERGRSSEGEKDTLCSDEEMNESVHNLRGKKIVRCTKLSLKLLKAKTLRGRRQNRKKLFNKNNSLKTIKRIFDHSTLNRYTGEEFSDLVKDCVVELESMYCSVIGILR